MLPNFSPSRERSLLVYFFVVYFASLSVFCLRFLYKSGNVQRNFKLILAAVEFLSCTDKNSYIFVHVSLVLSLSWQETNNTCLALFSEGQGLPRATTSHARCKEVRHGRVSFGLFLSDLN